MTSTTTNPTDSTYRALVFSSFDKPFTIQHRPTPPSTPPPGTVNLEVLATGILPFTREIYTGDRTYPFPTPIVGGTSAIARVIGPLPPDATSLVPGQLVFADCVIRSRDKPKDDLFLSAISSGRSEGSRKLMSDCWRDGPMAEMARSPLENCIPIDEERVLGNRAKQLGYTAAELTYFSVMLVPFGGMRDIGLQPGETVVVCPATGGFGGVAVVLALAMGARVVAMGRNEEALGRLKYWAAGKGEVETVKISGDEEADAEALRRMPGSIDAVLDLTPQFASQSTHLRSAIRALRTGGRVSMMGHAELVIPGPKVMACDITMKGKWMYERDDIIQLFKMVERGCFPRGADFVETKEFGLDEWKEAFDAAAEWSGIGRMVVMKP